MKNRLTLLSFFWYFVGVLFCLQTNIKSMMPPSPPMISPIPTMAPPSFPMPEMLGMMPPSDISEIPVPTQTAGAAMIPTPEMSPAAQVPEVSEPVGAETVSFPEAEIGAQGNWVKKREWLKESQKIVNEIQSLVTDIGQSRKMFQDKFVTVDGQLDSFYKQEGLSKGKIQVLLNDLEKYLEKKRKKEIEILKQQDKQRGVTGEFEIKLDLLEDDIRNRKIELEQLKLDMKSIEDLDKSLSERLKKLDEQINVAQDENIKARKLSNKIWYIIDDKKARLAFYELQGNILEKIKAIQNYVQQDLLNDFNNVMGVLTTQINKIKNEIKNLENKGLIIRDRAQRVEEIRLKQLEKMRAGKPVEVIEREEVSVEPSLLTKIYNFFVDLVAKPYSYIRELLGFKVREETVKVPALPFTVPVAEMEQPPAPPEVPMPPSAMPPVPSVSAPEMPPPPPVEMPTFPPPPVPTESEMMPPLPSPG